LKKYYNKIRRRIACFLVKKKHVLSLDEAVISFSFDDAPQSALQNGRGLLNNYGYKGTYFISLSLAEKTRPGGPYFNSDLLEEIVAEGGELGCHTYNHIHLYTVHPNELRSDLKLNQKRIAELVPGYTFQNFAYPWGEQRISTKRVISENFVCARGVNGGINSRHPDLNNLWSNQLAHSLPLQQVYALIDEVIRIKGWLIFYTHDVQENPSHWGCSPAYLESILRYCHKRKLKVCTFRQVVETCLEK
jgi:peptidoglycan/xylan/chitin deacetylase (PgdA/CDA1 family)